jgi:hypothetical protein
MDHAGKRDRATLHGNLYVLGFDLSISLQSILDPSLNVLNPELWLDFDLIMDTYNPRKPVNIDFRRGPLELPINLTAQCHPAMLNRNLNCVLRHDRVPSKNISRPLGDLVVRRFFLIRHANLDFFRNRPDTSYPANGALRRNFFRIARNVAGQRHDAVFDGNTDIRGIDTRLVVKLIQNMAAQLQIIHDRPPTLIPAVERFDRPLPASPDSRQFGLLSAPTGRF